jgi:hypothetical protein
MAFEKFVGDVNVVSSLDDSPKLTAAELKGKFDETGRTIADYLNHVHLPELDEAFKRIDDKMTTIPEIVDSLEDGNTKAALSAAMGKKLNEGKQNKILSGTDKPSGGEDGDIYIRY